MYDARDDRRTSPAAAQPSGEQNMPDDGHGSRILKIQKGRTRADSGRWCRVLLGFVACSGGWSAPLLAVARSDESQRVQFSRDNPPILADKCFQCHGPDAAQRQTELRLGLGNVAHAARDGRRAIVPGNLLPAN